MPSAYHEKIHAKPTRTATNTTQAANAMPKDLENFSFRGFAAANPTTMRISIQNEKTSNEITSLMSHFGAS
jgi:hypothetical protein